MSRARSRSAAIQATALVPAGARADQAMAELAILNEDAIEVFAKAVGGRASLADTLAVAGTGSDVERITTLLLDPRYAQWGLAKLCTMVGITVAELFASYRKAVIAKAHIEATHVIAGKLVPIVTDVMDKALSDPTVERHKLALELGQLLEKKGGLIVQQNNVAQTVNATGAGSLEQLQQAVGDLLFGERRPPDVIIPSPTRPPPEDDDPDHDADDAHDDEDVTPPRGLPETPVEPLAPPPDPQPS